MESRNTDEPLLANELAAKGKGRQAKASGRRKAHITFSGSAGPDRMLLKQISAPSGVQK